MGADAVGGDAMVVKLLQRSVGRGPVRSELRAVMERACAASRSGRRPPGAVGWKTTPTCVRMAARKHGAPHLASSRRVGSGVRPVPPPSQHRCRRLSTFASPRASPARKRCNNPQHSTHHLPPPSASVAEPSSPLHITNVHTSGVVSHPLPGGAPHSYPCLKTPPWRSAPGFVQLKDRQGR